MLLKQCGLHSCSWRFQCSTRNNARLSFPTANACGPPSGTADPDDTADGLVSRRLMLAALSVVPAVAARTEAWAVQGLTAGRVPGISSTADADGFFSYARPQGKSGGHGVGWSEIPVYRFKVPAGWQETPVSIADLGGTEIDLRYSSREQGDIEVVVAPVLRFSDVGFGANVRIEMLGPPERIIDGFAPELFGSPLSEGDVVDTQVVKDRDGLTYYYWELKRHKLVAATAVGNRLFIIVVAGNRRQWIKYEDKLRTIQQSFRVQAI